ncbi:MAG: winged helix-turn-helix transcriptional regulator, partial [Alkalinema sp. RL_2_19]|nr:winged helix-turn-helix transcriptional regulator [Alkalinema sp. RL_2_19]
GFQALSDPLRLQVLDLLREKECCVCDLCEMLDVSQSKLSFHLKSLKEAQLVLTRQEGRWIYYRLNLAQFEVLAEFLGEFGQLSQVVTARQCCE